MTQRETAPLEDEGDSSRPPPWASPPVTSSVSSVLQSSWCAPVQPSPNAAPPLSARRDHRSRGERPSANEGQVGNRPPGGRPRFPLTSGGPIHPAQACPATGGSDGLSSSALPRSAPPGGGGDRSEGRRRAGPGGAPRASGGALGSGGGWSRRMALVGAGGGEPHPGAPEHPGRAPPGEEVEGHPIGTSSDGVPARVGPPSWLEARPAGVGCALRAGGCPAALMGVGR
jgi:hypothetical protein